MHYHKTKMPNTTFGQIETYLATLLCMGSECFLGLWPLFPSHSPVLKWGWPRNASNLGWVSEAWASHLLVGMTSQGSRLCLLESGVSSLLLLCCQPPARSLRPCTPGLGLTDECFLEPGSSGISWSLLMILPTSPRFPGNLPNSPGSIPDLLPALIMTWSHTYFFHFCDKFLVDIKITLWTLVSLRSPK